MLNGTISLTVAMLFAASLTHADCVAPAALQSKVRAHADANTLTQLGVWFDGKHQYQCALQAYRSALQLNPGSAHILELLSSSLYSVGDVEGAIATLEKSVQLHPADVAFHVKLAALLEQVHRKEEAKAEWQRALQLRPKSPNALDGLSRHLIADGDYSAAIALLRSVPSDEKLTLDLAQAYGQADMQKDAEDLLTAALAQTPTSFPLTNALATVRVKQGLRQDALQLAQKFAAAHPDNLEAQTLHLRLLLLNNNTIAASPLAHKLLAARPEDPYLLYTTGTLERQNGDYQNAREHLQQAVALQPDVYASHYSLGLVLAKLDDPVGAKGQFERALALGAPEPEVHVELATVLRKLGKADEAHEQLRLYQEASDAQANRTVAQAKTTLAEKELSSGDPQKAVVLYREALQLTPNDAMLSYKLSVALDKARDFSGERDALEKAVQIDPDMAIAHNQLGYLASRAGDATSAEEHFRQAVRAAPAFTKAWVNLAATLGMESKFAEAQEAIKSALKVDPNNAEASQLRQDLTAAQAQH